MGVQSPSTLPTLPLRSKLSKHGKEKKEQKKKPTETARDPRAPFNINFRPLMYAYTTRTRDMAGQSMIEAVVWIPKHEAMYSLAGVET